jgi:hypothetical protein
MEELAGVENMFLKMIVSVTDDMVTQLRGEEELVVTTMTM